MPCVPEQFATSRMWQLTGAAAALPGRTALGAGPRAQSTAAIRPSPSRLPSPAQEAAVKPLMARRVHACTGMETAPAQCREHAATQMPTASLTSFPVEAAICSSPHRLIA